ncbi:MAG TPA: DUF1572 family protein [Gemmatimonadaceae bacterium]|nr:DUF1572 family protein [Gemmatimonadaceae bacterium]
MNTLIKSVEAEYLRYKAMAEGAFEQVPDDHLSTAGPGVGNSLAIICWHISGNLKSRFSDFLESDGEKPWRQRDEEFAERTVSRSEFIAKWNEGWDVLLTTLNSLSDDDLMRPVVIRGQSLPVHEALNRSVTHLSYHVGQIVYIAHAIAGKNWKYLSIPPGQSSAYNANPVLEKPLTHAENAAGKTS